ncbi:hypothetical protein Q31a_14240 [Aureliella helgolandensis]|uniref:Uncharacterized protein n=1 Tax=Aureliella helgolandensis TaxID=2527968 RepID=A0A518G3G0_9BACT|nr:hypothetical protein Q31a_14240 [Aureliella helgolandensis]
MILEQLQSTLPNSNSYAVVAMLRVCHEPSKYILGLACSENGLEPAKSPCPTTLKGESHRCPTQVIFLVRLVTSAISWRSLNFLCVRKRLLDD